MPAISSFLADTATPPIPEARRWLSDYDDRHGPAINLSQAAPSTAPPPSLMAALSAAAADPASAMYGPIRGEPDLIAAYARHVGDLYRTTIAPSEVAITAGCNEAFFVAALSVARAGDAILVPTPWYFNHAMTLTMLGIEPVALPTEALHGFVPQVAAARALIAARLAAGKSAPRAIVLVTPNNPTGAVYDAQSIAAFAALATEHDAWLIVDETYRDFLVGSGSAPIHALFTGAHRARVIQLYSFSKAYCIPGYRLGALIAPPTHMLEIDKVLDSLQICAGRVGQIAVAPAIAALEAWRVESAQAIDARARHFVSVLAGMTGWRIDALGAYFAYVAHPFVGRNDVEVARALAQTAGVLVLPGTYFGDHRGTHLRFAFANVDERQLTDLPRRVALARV